MTDSALPQKPILRVDEVARVFSVTPRTVYVWLEQGKLRQTSTPGGRIRIPRESVVLFLSVSSSGTGV